MNSKIIIVLLRGPFIVHSHKRNSIPGRRRFCQLHLRNANHLISLIMIQCILFRSCIACILLPGIIEPRNIATIIASSCIQLNSVQCLPMGENSKYAQCAGTQRQNQPRPDSKLTAKMQPESEQKNELPMRIQCGGERARAI